jgi:hypothetical protein
MQNTEALNALKSMGLGTFFFAGSKWPERPLLEGVTVASSVSQIRTLR